ncbi:hypothetical protein LOH54_02680 [Sulfurimonas sp. HSL-3221]|uniref:hypothetical protein n=1 Tax=Sulfurimonadaceae TaxID=2771471 RepID=UPI001E563797|nr:hypothetical protein [Sulfurimonas sp. HSL-3221]UFS63040.1 hypothetical protein LOH54_02680 [Sulfurimonas sp. HSL-3221]
MKFRDEQKLKKELDKQHIESYEHNLRLHYDAIRKELDLLLGSSIPHQFNIIKTILWLNVVLIGISFKVTENGALLWIVIPFFVMSLTSILIALFGMRLGKFTNYGVDQRIFLMSKIPDNSWTKTQGLLTMMHGAERAVRYNGINIIRRARLIRKAVVTTILSLLLLLILAASTMITIQQNGENIMADKKEKPTKPIVKPGTGYGQRGLDKKPSESMGGGDSNKSKGK